MTFQEAATAAERGECFQTLMEKVAAELGGYVYHTTTLEESGYRTIGELISGKERVTLCATFTIVDYKEVNLKADCFGVYPRTAKGEQYPSYGETRPSISFSVTRTPAQIAADIRRRLLPEYAKHLVKVEKWIDHTNRAAEELATTRALMQEAGFYFPEHSSTQGYMKKTRAEQLGRPQPSVWVYGGFVDMKLKDVTPEQALKVLQALDLAPVSEYA
jgi:hypothetical protein